MPRLPRFVLLLFSPSVCPKAASLPFRLAIQMRGMVFEILPSNLNYQSYFLSGVFTVSVYAGGMFAFIIRGDSAHRQKFCVTTVSPFFLQKFYFFPLILQRSILNTLLTSQDAFSYLVCPFGRLFNLKSLLIFVS